MRIIDKQHDFYDYLQDPTDTTIVFDRRGSFLLTKEIIIDKIKIDPQYDSKYKRLLLLQCGVMYWLIEISLNEAYTDYTVKLLCKEKDYNKPKELIKLSLHNYPVIYNTYRDYKLNKKANIDFSNYISNINGKYGRIISHNIKLTDYKNTFKKEEQNIPILKPSGISEIIDPIDIFTSIEEYFSMKKTEAERTEPIGATNDDKITMHGFDTKTSFRGKNK